MKPRQLLALSMIPLLAACGDTAKSDDATTAGDQDSMAMVQQSTNADPMADMKSTMDKMMADLKAINLTGNPDQDFALIMRSHHQGAVAMMQAYMPGASDAMLKTMAQSSIDKQNAEIEQLTSFINSHQSASGNNEYGKNAVQMIVDMMTMEAMPNQADKAFAMMMVPHHESAVHISQMYQSQGKDAQLKEMAKKIASDQQMEADTLKKWTQEHP